MFSVTDKLVDAIKSFVIYCLPCPGCNARYICETTRHLSIRIKTQRGDARRLGEPTLNGQRMTVQLSITM